jgi:hypothetical protein
VQQAAIDAVLASHRCDIRARLKALRHDPGPLFLAPAQVTRRPRDYLHPAIALIAFATVIVSVIVSVILHGKIRRIDNPITRLSDVAKFGRWGRRAAYVISE